VPAIETRRSAPWTGAVFAALAAILILLGTGSAHWWSGEKGGLESSVGLRAFELCHGDVCRSRALEGMGSGSEAWMLLGRLGTWTGGLTGLFLVLAAAAVVLYRAGFWPRLFGRVGAALSLISLVVGSGFAWTYPGFSGLGAGWAMAAYLGGAAIGVGSAGLLIAGGAARQAP
jgi:hypothetical protein